jgi:Tfp pilus assembly protein PilO
MTSRDRNVLFAVIGFAVVAAAWFLLISPKRAERTEVATQVAAAVTRRDAALATAADAQAARQAYGEDYAAVARLGKAVPETEDVPSLVFQLETLAKKHKVDMRSIKLTVAGGAGAAATTQSAAVASATGATPAVATESATATLPPGAVVGSAGFPTVPFSFSFTGGYFDMERFLAAVDGLTDVSADGKDIAIHGRLLTVNGVSYTAGPKGFPQVQAAVSATAYLLPAGEDVSAAAAAATPAAGTAALPAIAGAAR